MPEDLAASVNDGGSIETLPCVPREARAVGIESFVGARMVPANANAYGGEENNRRVVCRFYDGKVISAKAVANLSHIAEWSGYGKKHHVFLK